MIESFDKCKKGKLNSTNANNKHSLRIDEKLDKCFYLFFINS